MAAAVKLYVYDLTHGMARTFGSQLLGIQLDGIWHTGVVIYGREYFFGGGGSVSSSRAGTIGDPNISGVSYCAPGTTILGQPHQVLDLGNTEIPEDVMNEYLAELASSTFRLDTYKLFEHNCNHFSNEFSQFLTGNSIPDNILNLPQEVLSTPMGNTIRNLMGGALL